MGRGKLGAWKALALFPLTQDGWAEAWQALAKEAPEAAAKTRALLRERELQLLSVPAWAESAEITALDSDSLACLRDVTLIGGYAPEAAMAVGKRYDARFLQDKLAVFPVGRWQALAELPYLGVEDVEIGGPGLVRSGGNFAGGGFGAIGALEGMAVASVMNALTTRTSITTIVRVQGASCEFFLLHNRSTPDQLRIELSGPWERSGEQKPPPRRPARPATDPQPPHLWWESSRNWPIC